VTLLRIRVWSTSLVRVDDATKCQPSHRLRMAFSARPIGYYTSGTAIPIRLSIFKVLTEINHND
jgi:hypothetical protein